MSNLNPECHAHSDNEELFKRAVLRAVPAVRAQQLSNGNSIGIFFPIGTDVYELDTITSCAKAIIGGECQRYQYTENPNNWLSFEISSRSNGEASNDA